MPFAADITPERLVKADREPGNWLMNHRTYDAQRYAPLDKINRGNVKTSGLPMRSRSAAPRRMRERKSARRSKQREQFAITFGDQNACIPFVFDVSSSAKAHDQ